MSEDAKSGDWSHPEDGPSDRRCWSQIWPTGRCPERAVYRAEAPGGGHRFLCDEHGKQLAQFGDVLTRLDGLN